MTGHPDSTPTSITVEQATARRLARHALTDGADGSVGSDAPIEDVVRTICGAHAQVMPAAELAIGLRRPGTTRSDVRHALWSDRSLVKTFGPRGTVHLLPAADLPMWCGALGAIPSRSGLPVPARLSDDQTAAVMAVVHDALASSELTGDELDEVVIDACGEWAADRVVPAFGGYWPRWRQAIGAIAAAGGLCFGAERDRRVTYTNPRRWWPGFAPDPAGPALQRLVRGYLYAYGPATSADLARWLAAPRSWTRDLLAAQAERISPVDRAGVAAWVNAGDAIVTDPAPAGVRLLPYFDPYLVGAQPREVLFPGLVGERVLPGGQAGPVPVVLLDGMAVGVWHHRRSGGRLQVTVEDLQPLRARTRQAVAAEVDRVAAILETPADLRFGPRPVGPHA
jgi:Winged helix DNA-binding domain